MRYADDSCRSALLQRLLPLRQREPYGAALDMRFASENQPDRNPLPPYVRFRTANINRRPSARGRLLPNALSSRPHPCRDVAFLWPHGIGVDGGGGELRMAEPALQEV